MITRIQALNYCCLQYVDQRIGPFHLLVGANASGKSTFFDVIGLLHDIVENGPKRALADRTNDYRDLLYGREGKSFELAVEARIPEAQRKLIVNPEMDTVRYELSLGKMDKSDDFLILAEKLLVFKTEPEPDIIQRKLFPWLPDLPKTIISSKTVVGVKTILNKVPGKNDNFHPETKLEKRKRWTYSFKLGPTKSSLGNLPDDEEKFPVATWFRDSLVAGVQRFILNSSLMKRPSPPTSTKGFLTDGSNLPWVVERLKTSEPDSFSRWISHLQTALPDLKEISTVERPEDRHRSLILKYRGGIEVPSWLASDGTLRLMALTLPAYLRSVSGIYLIEEPENGIHPKAVETVFQSLSSVYDAQVLLATHSPVLLSLIDPDKTYQVLCFAKTKEGATDIIGGDRHPKLRSWRGDPNISLLFAGGILG